MENGEVVHLTNIKSLCMKAQPRAKTQPIFLLFLFSLIPILTFADIIPNPIQVKGIIPSHSVNIQMVSERVNVQLSMDSASVECVFNMRNLGESEDLEIGFPIMSFYLFNNHLINGERDLLNDINMNSFEVMVNGIGIKKVNFYIPDYLKNILNSVNDEERYKLIGQYENQNKPWYLWKSHFNKDESQVIIVKYILPNGANHQNRFFNYLLSTGAGWAGKIERAEILINLTDLPSDQLVSITPKHYKLKGKQLSWVFKNLKPNTADDILVKYEMAKGSYEAQKRKNDSVVFFVDGKKTKTSLGKLNPNDIADIIVNRKPPYQKNGAIYVYTKAYPLENFKKKIKRLNRAAWKQISNESTKTIETNYQLIVNDKTFTGEEFFNKIKILDTIPILRVSIKQTDSHKKSIILVTKE
jgi:hypothetical protein